MEMHLPFLEETKQDLIRRIQAHSFLSRCRQGTVTLPELKIFLVQHGIYGSYFTRYLCALMANLPNNEHVLRLAENLCDELGLTTDSTMPHSTIYRAMLAHFGLNLEGARPFPGTRRMIDTMFDHCRNPNPARGLGALCLGAEALVPAVYADIISGFTACGTPDTAIEFFHMHVQCDDAHADTMRDLMVEIAQRDPDQGTLILNAGNAMVDARLDFFSAIEMNCRSYATARTTDAMMQLADA